MGSFTDKPNIDKMEKEKDYKGLVQALSHPDPEVRRKAAEALGRIAEKGEARAVVEAGAVPKLVECLDDADEYVRGNAAYALDRIAWRGEARAVVEAGAVPKLVKCLDDENKGVRANAACALGEIAKGGEARAVVSAGAVPKLVKCLDDAHENVRGNAALALGSIAEKGEARAVVSAGAVPKLVKCLDDENKGVRANAACALGEIAKGGEARAVVDAGAVPRLVERLDDAHEYVRGNAAWALGSIAEKGDARAVVDAGGVPKLVKCLDDENKDVRVNAAWALGEIAYGGEARAVVSAGAVPKLVKCLDDENKDVRGNAAWALGEIAYGGEARAVVSAGAVPKLVECLGDEVDDVRRYPAFALGRIAEKGEARAVVSAGAVPKLVKCLDDENDGVRVNAALALDSIFGGFAESVENELAEFRSMGINTAEEERLVRELKESTERVDWKKCAELVGELTLLVAKHTEKLIVTLRERASEFENELARLHASGIDTQKGENLLNALKESIGQKDLRKCEEFVKEISGLVAQYNQELKRQIASLREQANRFENELARLRASGIDTQKGESSLNALKESIEREDLKKCEELVKEITELMSGYQSELERRITSLREQANRFANDIEKLRASGIDLSRADAMLAELRARIEQTNLRNAEEVAKALTAELERLKEMVKPIIEVEFQDVQDVAVNKWGRATLRFSNQGNDDAKDVICEVSGRIEVDEKMYEIMKLRKGEYVDIEMSIKPLDEGHIPVRVKVRYRRGLDDKEYEEVLKPDLYVGARPSSASAIPERESIEKRYELLEKLHDGRYSTVWKARRRWDGQIVALKLPKEEGGRIFVREMDTVRHLRHPNIVQVFDFNATPPHIAMEFVSGENLKEYLAGKPSEVELGKIFYDTISALIYAFEMRGVVNCDLKPEHIMIDNGRVKIVDWGGCFRTFSSTTSLKEVPFTQPWAPPELVNRERTPDEKTMSHLIGAMMWWAFSGEKPPIKDIENAELNVRNKALKALIRACVQRKPEERPDLITIAEQLNEIFHLNKDVGELRRYKKVDEREKLLLEMTGGVLEEALKRGDMPHIKELLDTLMENFSQKMDAQLREEGRKFIKHIDGLLQLPPPVSLDEDTKNEIRHWVRRLRAKL